MTDKKISELTSITGANVSDANDVLPIVDTSVATTKKITRAELFKSVSSVDINGGTIDGTVIGGASAAAATFTDVTANGAINFTGATVSDGGSVATVDINGGTIDGTVIGGSTPAAISGTTGQFGTSLNVDGTITSDGLTVESTGAAAALFRGYTSITGVNSANSGEVLLGNNSAFQGLISYVGQAGALYIENSWDNDAADIVFRAKSSGTAENKLLIEGNGDISFYEDTGTTPKFFWDASAEALGLGTTSLLASLHIQNGSSTHMYLSGSSGDPYGMWVSPTGSSFTLGSWGNGSRIVMSDSSEYIMFGTGPSSTGRVRIDSSGNVLIGGTVTPTSSFGNLVLYNGTAPTGNATDGVVLYAEDVSASSELKVRDEAGNVTTLSPHNFDLIPEGPSEEMAWSYYSERDGKRINVDMLKAIRLLEQITGEKLVHMA